MRYYPITIKLKNKKAIVVGGGNVAERKVLGLLEPEANIRVVSPVLTEPQMLRNQLTPRLTRWGGYEHGN